MIEGIKAPGQASALSLRRLEMARSHSTPKFIHRPFEILRGIGPVKLVIPTESNLKKIFGSGTWVPQFKGYGEGAV